MDPLLTIEQAAAALGTKAWFVRNAISTGELPIVRLGRLIRIEPADLQAFKSSRRDVAKTVDSASLRPVESREGASLQMVETTRASK